MAPVYKLYVGTRVCVKDGREGVIADYDPVPEWMIPRGANTERLCFWVRFARKTGGWFRHNELRILNDDNPAD